MHRKIEQALDLIEQETVQGEYDRVFDAVRAIVEAFGETDLADRLMELVPLSVPAERIAMLFNFLAWQTDDNGSAVTRAAERWLRDAVDLRKCRVALGLDVYPFVDEQEMYRVLSSLAVVEPELMAQCEHLIASRKASGSPR